MRLLVDTHVLLWILQEPSKLSRAAVRSVSDPNAEVYVSAVSFWEIALKVQLGKMALEGITMADLPQTALDSGLKMLDLDVSTASGFASLPLKQGHRDPFDRMIIHQAITGGFMLLSKDALFGQYLIDGLDLRW
ncbi:MAG: type II toxin-antitoxin system VapC family toxin [Coriobacteriales bacterium]|jgi:PIN domain nuclease of toxin-antitoxin system|nr:type II toxin-antitoxin system VapC family toxin [Coriobacteriales bacterium]